MADDAQLPAPTDNAGLRALAGGVQINMGSLAPKTLAEVMDFGQLMAKAGPMVGKAFRGNPGACVAITMQAMQWNMSPFAVSQKAYVTNDNIAYEAQLVTAVINAHAPVQERPQYSFDGEGQKRRCTITATLRGDTKPCVYVSPEIGQITTKNSPLWKTDADQQLGYYSIRAWARRYCPEIIMGVYTPEEMADVQQVVSSQPIANEYDQRPPEEIAEEGGAPGMFLKGEAKDLVVREYTRLFAEADTEDALEKHMKHFRRIYWNNTTKTVSQNTFDGIEILFDEARARLTKGASLLPWFTSYIEGCDTLAQLEEWFNGQDTRARFERMAEEFQGKAQTAYEVRVEVLADEALKEIDAARASANA